MTTDAIVQGVRDKLAQRAAVGLAKYGTTMERTDLTRLDWLHHAQQEAMDLAVYLERLIQDEELPRNPRSLPRAPKTALSLGAVINTWQEVGE
jgi:hypothetical protein